MSEIKAKFRIVTARVKIRGSSGEGWGVSLDLGV